MLKVKWPALVCVETALFFPIAVSMAAVLTPGDLPRYLGHLIAGSSAGTGPQLIEAALLLAVPASIAAVLFLALLVAVDRLLIRQRGFAVLALLATIIWAAAAVTLSPALQAWLPSGLADGLPWMSFPVQATLAAVAASVVLHQKIFWIGVRDNGFAAGRLGIELKADSQWRANMARRQPAVSRTAPDEGVVIWSLRRVLRDIRWLLHKLTESVMFQAMIGCFLGVILLAGWAYYAYQSAPPQEIPAQTEVARDAGPREAAPQVVQDEGDTMTTATTPIVTPRDYEGAGERDAEGRYLFDVLVNNIPMPMRYDDDILCVTIRAEDARRLGVSFPRLDFSNKIKTAKGLLEVAGITISAMTIGTITYRNVPGYVARPGALAENILGHSFLGRLAAYRVENHRLVLIDRQGQSEVVSAVRRPTQ